MWSWLFGWGTVNASTIDKPPENLMASAARHAHTDDLTQICPIITQEMVLEKRRSLRKVTPFEKKVYGPRNPIAQAIDEYSTKQLKTENILP